MRAVGRDIERRDLSVYDLNPAEIQTFDFIYVGSLLLHLRDPVLALERIRSVCRGEMLLVDTYSTVMTALHPRRPVATLDGQGRPWWWTANRAGLAQMVRSAGFELVAEPQRVSMPAGRGQAPVKLSQTVLRDRAVRTAYRIQRWGDPHLAIRARPA
jgi:tRNA (mo5U34)-methyltransferase